MSDLDGRSHKKSAFSLRPWQVQEKKSVFKWYAPGVRSMHRKTV